MSLRLKAFAIADLSRARGIDELAQELRESGEQIAGYGAGEVQDGLDALAAAEMAARASESAAQAGQTKLAEGLADLAAAEGMRDVSQQMTRDGLGDMAEGANAIGETETSGAT
jgi:hypothetical protein